MFLWNFKLYCDDNKLTWLLLANIFTKPIPRDHFSKIRLELGIEKLPQLLFMLKSLWFLHLPIYIIDIKKGEKNLLFFIDVKRDKSKLWV